jgi:6-carboxyhexanoate--CoA ligase
MWNIRMRASRRKARGNVHDIGCRPVNEEHISGAEGIYPKTRVHSIVQSYIDRARNHPKGRPDSIHIAIEKLVQKPQPITALPVVTLKCVSPGQAESYIRRLLVPARISEKAFRTACAIVRDTAVMRGAALVHARSGMRVEPDKERGIRASHLGITAGAESRLSRELAEFNISTPTVKEALVLASKVAACPDIVAELCVSDDPHYTTGYIATRDIGYIRIPHIKKSGSSAGGRVFFLKETADARPVVRYLERTPVLVSVIQPCLGEASLHEILDHHH